MGSLQRFFLLLTAFALVLTLVTGCSNQPAAEEDLLLHVPSPDWSDQLIYFIVTDRFNDGDTGNSYQGDNEYDPSNGERWSGGDLQGIIDQLDYIQGLGATAIWITPPVRNTNWDVDSAYSGYHGYHATNFVEVDPHLGDLETYRELSSELHKRGMYLIQDVVTNHTANLFRYKGEYNPEDPTQNLVVAKEAPTQPPFHLNDPRREEDRKRAIYHFTPGIVDYEDSLQVLTWGMGGLDDLNTSNPEVREALKKSFRYWIDSVGVDGYRFDTPVYVEHDFWHDFMHSRDAEGLGMIAAAEATGRNDFFNFGETWYHNPPYSDEGIRKSAKFLGTPEKPEMASVLNFPLQQAINRVCAGGAAPAELSSVLERSWKIYERPERLVNFIDNHDMARFRSKASQAAFEQAMYFLMTLPGVPVIYYGTEQNLREPRSSMFAAGYGSDGIAHFDASSKDYLFIRELMELRKAHAALRKGEPVFLGADSVGPGWLAYKLATAEEELLLLYNTSLREVVTPELKLADGPVEIELLHGVRNTFPPQEQFSFRSGADGSISLVLPGKSSLLFSISQAEPSTQTTKLPGTSVEPQAKFPLPQIDYTQKGQYLTVSGNGRLPSSFLWTIDGKVISSSEYHATSKGWQVRFPMLTEHDQIELKLLRPAERFQLPESLEELKGEDRLLEWTWARTISVVEEIGAWNIPISIPTRTIAEQSDPIGDDSGLDGNYAYPTDPTFDGQNDFEHVKIEARGTNLILTITMAKPLSTLWKPPNGFDHLLLTAYIDYKDSGIPVLPLRNAKMPDGKAWDLTVFAAGWSSGIYHFWGSSASANGTASHRSPLISTRPEARQIVLEIPAEAFGEVQNFADLTVYLTSWDGGGVGELRPLEQNAASFSYGGSADPLAPLIMDAVLLSSSSAH